MKTIIIVSAIVYLASFLITYRWKRIAHSKGGKYERFGLGSKDLVGTICPIINTISCVLSIFHSPRKKPLINLNKFFRIK